MSSYVDPQTLGTWSKYKKGMCEGCWSGCCTLPVEVRLSDLVRLELITAEEAEWDVKLVLKKLLKKKLVQSFSPKTKLFILSQVSGRDCIFLHPYTRRCTVYEKRPDTCRNFPTQGPKPGHCPHRKI